MRPTTLAFGMNQEAGPSSPPETPMQNFRRQSDKPRKMDFPRPIPMPGINPTQGSQFSYDPGHRPEDLSPQSRSLSRSSSISLRSSRSEAAEPFSESPPSPRIHRRIVADANFTLEEVRESDYENMDNDDENKIIRPHQYEDAESDRGVQMKTEELDTRIVDGMEHLVFEDCVQRRREKKKLKRRTSSIVQKRKISESIGSSDEEDLQPVQVSVGEAGSSARRLRRKVGERASPSFDDTSPGIPELEEPESCEEVVEDDGAEVQGVDRHLPFYVQVMDVDSDDD